MKNNEKGILFEKQVKELFEREYDVKLEAEYPLEIGFKSLKSHKFDFGNSKILLECKDYSWTSGNNIPSAKICHLKEVMLYFHLAPKNYKKILILNRNIRGINGESVGEYFIRLNKAFIPEDVEIFEIENENIEKIY